MNMKIIASFLLIFLISSCSSLAPGMFMDSSKDRSNNSDFVVLDPENNTKIYLEKLSYSLIESLEPIKPYKVGIGDKLSITVWGLPDIFPMYNVSTDNNLRAVNTDGSIFFPYVGSIQAYGKTQVELRKEITEKLGKFFNDPQLDVSIASFVSQKIYILGEVTRPQKLSITETPISLTDALGLVNGLNTNTSSAREVFVIRQAENANPPRIFQANLSTPASLILADEFYLKSQDIIYVNASGTTRWNRVISQFFPFSSFLNSLDNLQNN